MTENSAVVDKITREAPMLAGSRALRIGFVPLTDCAPLIMAHELGLFRKYDLRVVLSRELGWATIRDKVIHGQLHAAHALAPMPVAATLGLGSVRCDCCTALVLNLHGNAITLSNDLWQRGVRDGATLREEVLRSRQGKVLTFGTVFPFSSHNFLLRGWLAAAGIDPARDVRIVVLPPPQLAASLAAGYLDGFCAGEPWNSVAIRSKAGWCVATSAELAPGHPEKVLMVRRDFAENAGEQHLALVAALLEACAFCDAAENVERIVGTLAQPDYLDVPEVVLRRAIGGDFDFGHGKTSPTDNLLLFHRLNTNEPSGDKVAWVLRNIRASGLCPEPAELDFNLGRSVFRQDIYHHAVLHSSISKEIIYEQNSNLPFAIA